MPSLTNTNLTFTRESGAHYGRRNWQDDALVMTWVIPSGAAGVSKNYAYGSSGITNRSFKIDWGDGTIDTFSSAVVYYLSHTYAAAGTYTVQIYDQSGDGMEVMRFGSGGADYTGANNMITDILQWPTGYSVDSWQKVFFDCDNIGKVSATNIPDLSGTRFLTSLFENSGDNPRLNNSFENWDTSNVQDMRYMFKGTKIFNNQYLIDQNDLTRSGWTSGYVTRTTTSATLPSGATGTYTQLRSWDTPGSEGSVLQYGGSSATNDRLTGNVSGTRVFGVWAKAASLGNCTFELHVNSASATHTVNSSEGWKYFTVSGDAEADGNDNVKIKATANGQDIDVFGANLSINGESEFCGFDVGEWDVTGLTSAKGATNMFYSNSAVLENWAISTFRYDDLLEKWGAQAGSVNSGVALSAGSTKYTAGGAAATGRAALVTAGWTITDGGTT